MKLLKFISIPVRILVDVEGPVKRVPVIHATDERRKSIEEALRQWNSNPTD